MPSKIAASDLGSPRDGCNLALVHLEERVERAGLGGPHHETWPPLGFLRKNRRSAKQSGMHGTSWFQLPAKKLHFVGNLVVVPSDEPISCGCVKK